MIDELILPAIQILNDRGYHTTASCSGHVDKGYQCAYIQFAWGEITPETLPEGWRWAEDGLMEYMYQNDFNNDDIEIVMLSLCEWAKTLSNTR